MKIPFFRESVALVSLFFGCYAFIKSDIFVAIYFWLLSGISYGVVGVSK